LTILDKLNKDKVATGYYKVVTLLLILVEIQIQGVESSFDFRIVERKGCLGSNAPILPIEFFEAAIEADTVFAIGASSVV
jgi:hypothetical protein